MTTMRGTIARRLLTAAQFAVVLAIALLACRTNAVADGVWELIGRSLKETEQHRAFCNKNPGDDRCKDRSASAVLVWCEREDDAHGRGLCHGALAAYAAEGVSLLPEWQCVPQAVSRDNEQLRRLFLREAQRVPEVLHEPARRLLYYAVLKAFPCALRAR